MTDLVLKYTRLLLDAERLKEKDPFRALPLFISAYAVAQQLRSPVKQAYCLSHLGDCSADITPRRAQEALRFYSEALAVLEHLDEATLRAKLLYSQALIHYDLGDRSAAEPLFGVAMSIFQENQDWDYESRCAYYLAECLFQTPSAEIDQAVGLFQNAARLFHVLGNGAAEAKCIFQIGRLQESAGRLAQAIESWYGALKICEAQRDKMAQLKVKLALGSLFERMQNYTAARVCFRESIDLARRVPDLFLEAHGCMNLGALEQQLGQHEEAAKLLQRAMRIYRKMGDASWEAQAHLALADSFYECQEWKLAKGELHRAVEIFRERHDSGGLQEALRRSAETHVAMKDLEAARRCYERACGISRTLKDRPALLEQLMFLGDLNRSSQYLIQCQENNEEALAIARELGDMRAEARCLYVLGSTHAQSNPPLAESFFKQALDVLSELTSPDDKRQAAHCLMDWAAVIRRSGNLEKSRDMEKEVSERFRDLWDPHEQAHAIARQGEIELALGNAPNAVTLWTVAQNILRAEAFILCASRILRHLIEGYLMLGEWEKCAASFLELHAAMQVERRAESPLTFIRLGEKVSQALTLNGLTEKAIACTQATSSYVAGASLSGDASEARLRVLAFQSQHRADGSLRTDEA